MDATSSSPREGTVVWSYVAVLVAGVGAWLIYTRTDPNPLILNVEGFSVFAPLYIAAQAIERFLEPFAARFNVTTVEKLALKRARQHKARLEGLPAGDPPRTLAKLEEADQKVVNAELALAQ